jgi:hypothetical protein
MGGGCLSDEPAKRKPPAASSQPPSNTTTLSTTAATKQPNGPASGDVQFIDVGLESGYVDFWFGTYKSGRGNVVADYDGDGDLDVFSGNPANESFLIINITEPGGPLRFEPGQVLSEDGLYFGGVAADLDNDLDPDLFISAGANDGQALDQLLRNDGDPTAPFVNTLADLVPLDRLQRPQLNGTMGARAADFDLDGLLDIWASNWATKDDLAEASLTSVLGVNQLYLNRGDLVLEDVAEDAGLDTQRGTRNSAIFDFDQDGDMDIYENNHVGAGVFWRNNLVEDGTLTFTDDTQALSLGGRPLLGALQQQAMCAIPADLDNDGWEDLVVLLRGMAAHSELVTGHLVFMNQQGLGFVEVGDFTGISAAWWEHPATPGATDTGIVSTAMSSGDDWGVMGCQVGDMNLDGYPDFFFGNGVGARGAPNNLMISAGLSTAYITGYGSIQIPTFADWSDKIHHAAEAPDGAPHVPYAYRTHGTTLSDFDGDGVPELAIHNGGPASKDYLEPNRLFKIALPDPRYLRVDLRGDGVAINADAVGARVKAQIRRESDGAEWSVYKTRYGGSGFAAQNDPQLLFGLADGDEVELIEVTWPDGQVDQVTPPSGNANTVVVQR